MKRVGELMQELGFKEEGSFETKKAFIENLVRAATGEKWTSSKQILPDKQLKAPHKHEQLSFEFTPEEPSALVKKSS